MRLTLTFLLIAGYLSTLKAEDVVFPIDAGIKDIRRDYGAKGDGIADDTAAFQVAYKETGLLYIPDGTYLISDSIVAPPRKGSASCRRVLQGQSTERTIIKLKDSASGFDDSKKPKPMLKVSWGVAQAFRNGVRNLTFDCGSGNPGAIGIEYFASNQGGIHFVNIRSGDGKGATGLLMTGDNGPMLVKNLRVEGFDIGIDSSPNHLVTMEHIVLRGQTTCGMRVTNKTVVRDLKSDNKVPAVMANGPEFVLIDGALSSGTGVAMNINGRLGFVRNLKVDGYDTAIEIKSETLPGPTIEEWSSRAAVSLFPGTKHSLNLPVKETPEVSWDELKNWANATAGAKGNDVTESFQKAVDSGAKTIYFSRGNWTFSEVHLRKDVQRVIGLETTINSKGCRLILDDGTSPTVVIERFDTIYAKLTVEHKSKRSLVISSMVADEIKCKTGCGDLFLEDVCLGNMDIAGNSVWARQFNPEYGNRPAVINDGGTLWLFGLKTEGDCTKVRGINGSRSEIYGYILANKNKNDNPMFVIEDSVLSASIVEDVLRKAPFKTVIQETRNGTTKTLDGGKGTSGVAIPLLLSGQ